MSVYCRAEGDPLSWEIIEHGISAVIARDRSLMLCICDPLDGEVTSEFEITDNSKYTLAESDFHTFLCLDEFDDEHYYGLSFLDEMVGKNAGQLITQLIPSPQASPEAEGPSLVEEVLQSETDQGIPKVNTMKLMVMKNIGRFFKSKKRLEAPPPHRPIISGPSDFRHVEHSGVCPPPYESSKLIEAGEETSVSSATSEGRDACLPVSRKRSPESTSSDPKRKKLVISEPTGFKHVSHIGADSSFGPKDEKGIIDVAIIPKGIQLQEDDMTAEETSKMETEEVGESSSKDEHPKGNIEGKTDQQEEEAVPEDTPPQRPPRRKDLIKQKKAMEEVSQTQSENQSGNNVKTQDEKTEEKNSNSSTLPVVAPEDQQEQEAVMSSQGRRRPPPPPPMGEVTHQKDKDGKVKEYIELQPMGFDHNSFLEEIEKFSPGTLKNVQKDPKERESVTTRVSMSQRLSITTIMKEGSDKMIEKLQSLWSESIVAFLEEEDSGIEEFDFGGLIEQ